MYIECKGYIYRGVFFLYFFFRKVKIEKKDMTKHLYILLVHRFSINMESRRVEWKVIMIITDVDK